MTITTSFKPGLLSQVYSATSYVPVVSTLTSLINLFLKVVVLPLLSPKTIAKSYFWTHLQEETLLSCVAPIFPVLGNIGIGIRDCNNRKWNDRNWILQKVQEDGNALGKASLTLRNDVEFLKQVNGVCPQVVGRYVGNYLRENTNAICQIKGMPVDDSDSESEEGPVAKAVIKTGNGAAAGIDTTSSDSSSESDL